MNGQNLQCLRNSLLLRMEKGMRSPARLCHRPSNCTHSQKVRVPSVLVRARMTESIEPALQPPLRLDWIDSSTRVWVEARAGAHIAGVGPEALLEGREPRHEADVGLRFDLLVAVRRGHVHAATAHLTVTCLARGQ